MRRQTPTSAIATTKRSLTPSAAPKMPPSARQTPPSSPRARGNVMVIFAEMQRATDESVDNAANAAQKAADAKSAVLNGNNINNSTARTQRASPIATTPIMATATTATAPPTTRTPQIATTPKKTSAQSPTPTLPPATPTRPPHADAPASDPGATAVANALARHPQVDLDTALANHHATAGIPKENLTHAQIYDAITAEANFQKCQAIIQTPPPPGKPRRPL